MAHADGNRSSYSRQSTISEGASGSTSWLRCSEVAASCALAPSGNPPDSPRRTPNGNPWSRGPRRSERPTPLVRPRAVAVAVRPQSQPQPQSVPKSKPAPAPPARNDAITLLATLQREARFVDIVKEPLADYSDAQVGAAARDVLRDCGAVLDRLFDVQPIVDKEEGADVDLPAGFDAGRFRVTGNVTGEAPYTGPLVHHGWEAKRCALPQWSGSKDAGFVVAPAELEVKE